MTRRLAVFTLWPMNAVELSEAATLAVPPEVASRLPKANSARVIVLTDAPDRENENWRAASYEQFLADDAPEDAICDSLPR